MSGNRRRRNGKIDRLPVELREEVDQMILTGMTYREIVEYLGNHEVQLSKQAVCNYARKFLATTQMLRVAQENFRMLMDDMSQYPDLDTTEGIIRIMSNSILHTLANTTQDDWQGMDMEKLLKEANSLVRVASQKRRVDVQNRTETETALEANKGMLADLLAKKHPELYRQVMQVIDQEQQRLEDREEKLAQ